MSMESWRREHTLAAARQGWCISQCMSNQHAPWEVQRLDDAESASEDYGVQVPQLASDDEAVQVLREAWQRGEPHAVLAYQLLRENSPQEFAYWRMEEWTC